MCWSLMPRFLGWAGLISAALLSSAVSAQATTWDRISRDLRLLKEAGIEALVAQDCPAEACRCLADMPALRVPSVPGPCSRPPLVPPWLTVSLLMCHHLSAPALMSAPAPDVSPCSLTTISCLHHGLKNKEDISTTILILW